MQDIPLGFRPRRAARKLDVSLSTIWRLCRRGELEAVRLSERTTIITADSINALVARGRVAVRDAAMKGDAK